MDRALCGVGAKKQQIDLVSCGDKEAAADERLTKARQPRWAQRIAHQGLLGHLHNTTYRAMSTCAKVRDERVKCEH